MTTNMPKNPFTMALGISLIIHGAILFSSIPKSQNFKSLTERLSFRPSRYTIKSILTKDPVSKAVPNLQKALPKKQKTKENLAPITKSVPEQIQKPNSSEVKSFEDAIIKNTPPTYPRIARKRKWQGDVELLLKISPRGNVEKINVLSTNAHNVLVNSALESAKSWKFTPSESGLSYQVKKVVKYRLK